MLPSVSAGSAALTKYAQAVAVAAPESPARESDATPRHEQEAARQKADKQPVATSAQDTLARDARDTVDRLLNLLHTRVLTAMLDLGVPEALAAQAAETAVVQLASAIAGNSRHAAQIVHALLQQAPAGQSDTPERLLLVAAKGLTVVIDHRTGDVHVTPPRLDLIPAGGGAAQSAAPHHILDFTDYDADRAAPVLQALGTIHATASAAAAGGLEPSEPGFAAGRAYSAFVVAPDAFVTSLTAQLTPILQNTGTTAQSLVADAAKTISVAVSQVLSTAINGVPANSIPVADIMAAVGNLQQTGASGPANMAGTDRIVLTAGKIAVAIDPRNSSVTVQIGNQVTAFAPASLPTPVSLYTPLPGLDAASLPVADIRTNLPVGTILDQPTGIPFVPPEISEMPAPGASPGPLRQPAPHQAAQNAAYSAIEDENLRLLDPAVMRNATFIRGVSPAAGSDMPGVTRIALDINAEFGPGGQSNTAPPPIGKFGRPQQAPAQAENGPVMRNGYADASANLVPVMPAWHARGQLPDRAPKKKATPKQLTTGGYQSIPLDDAFTREMPKGHQGLVFTSFVFSV